MSKGTIISLCDKTGVMIKPWAEAGYDCFCFDIQHPGGINRVAPNTFTVGTDVLKVTLNSQSVYAAFAFPPCTDLAVSGARWFKEKGLKRLIYALTVVEKCRELIEYSGARWMLENPVSVLSSYWRKPDHIFDPCDYGGYLIPPGDAFTKRTCLWTGGGFVMPPKKWVEPTEGSKMQNLPGSRIKCHRVKIGEICEARPRKVLQERYLRQTANAFA